MTDLPQISSSCDVTMGKDPILDAWILNFMTENNLEYLLDPLSNASPEQLRFMVNMEEDKFYAPCSDELLQSLMQNEPSARLLHSYNTTWRVLDRLVAENITDSYMRRRILEFCKHRFNLALASHILIPSRLMKRLTAIFLTQSGLDDPYREQKKMHNARVQNFLSSKTYDELINYCRTEAPFCGKLQDLRWELDLHELQRLITLSTFGGIWHGANSAPSKAALLKEVEKPCPDFQLLVRILDTNRQSPKKILYLPRASGGIMFDIRIIQCLLRMGHKVILALKEGFHFQTPAIWDPEYDPALAHALKDAHFLQDHKISKNDLIHAMRANQFVVISDGTVERLNLYRVNVTFARAWKEADLVIAKGSPNVRRLIQTKHNFTRDILCFFRNSKGDVRLHFKPKPESVVKFSEADLTEQADQIIQSMREAKSMGKTVMFYSAIVGSVPGQTEVAIKVLNATVNYLRSRMEGTFIINPAEHFIPGMDGDDLMFMWEIVQRSGLLNVWRFQTFADIEKSFMHLDEKVPPIWAGKDSTYSTGCTKEMKIALDVLKQHPELQIIGPSPERFFRRREYGVGQYYDSGIEYK